MDGEVRHRVGNGGLHDQVVLRARVGFRVRQVEQELVRALDVVDELGLGRARVAEFGDQSACLAVNRARRLKTVDANRRERGGDLLHAITHRLVQLDQLASRLVLPLVAVGMGQHLHVRTRRGVEPVHLRDHRGVLGREILIEVARA